MVFALDGDSTITRFDPFVMKGTSIYPLSSGALIAVAGKLFGQPLDLEHGQGRKQALRRKARMLREKIRKDRLRRQGGIDRRFVAGQGGRCFLSVTLRPCRRIVNVFFVEGWGLFR